MLRRLRSVLLAAGACTLLVGVGVGMSQSSSTTELDQEMYLAATEASGTLVDHNSRSESTLLLTARSPWFRDYFTLPGDAPRLAQRPRLADRISATLEYLQRLNPRDLGEVSLLGADGRIVASVVEGVPTPTRGYVIDPAATRHFLAPALQLEPGEVFQSEPYQATGGLGTTAGTWVTSYATPLRVRGEPVGVLQFQVRMESFRAQLTGQADLDLAVIDSQTGYVVIDGAVAEQSDGPLGNPANHLPVAVIQQQSGTTTVVGDERFVTSPVPATDTAAPDWTVVVSTVGPPAAWTGLDAPGPVGLALAGALLIALAAVGHRLHVRRISRDARVDDLTGLPNRLAFRERIEHLLAREEGCSVLLLDLDRFKEVNDSYGHAAGDALLRAVAERLTGTLPPSALAARLSGDEFVVVDPGASDGRLGQQLAERVAQALEQPFRMEGLAVRMTASVGVAVAPDDAVRYSELLRKADVAMYAAKRTRVGARLYAEELDRHAVGRLHLAAELADAIRTGELVLHYQPMVAMPGRTVVRYEALVRWQHPRVGLLPPRDFLPIAEDTGQIRALTRWALAEALDQVVAWRAGGQQVGVSVNISALDVMDPAFAGELAGELAARRLPGDVLIVELTETALLTDTDTALEQMRQVAALGVGLAVDDFGSGYASLMYLKRLPLTHLKLDRELVVGIVENRSDLLIARAAVELGHGLGLSVVAEGIEDEAVLRAAAALGCDEAQGYLLGRPAPAATVPPVPERTVDPDRPTVRTPAVQSVSPAGPPPAS